MNREEISKLSFDCVLPSSIFFNDKLEPNCIKFYAIVRNLSRMNGYCFATNEYLSQMMNSDERSVQRWLKNLCKEGYFEIITDKNGIQHQRKIYLSDKFKKFLQDDNFVTPPRQFCHSPPTILSPIKKNKYSKEEKKNIKPPNPLVKKKPFSAFDCEPPTEKAEELSNYFYTSQKKRKSDYSLHPDPDWAMTMDILLIKRSGEQIKTILDWALKHHFWSNVIVVPENLLKNLDKIEIQMNNTKKTFQNGIEENKKIAKKLKEDYGNRNDIDFCDEYIGFNNGANCYITINYKSLTFKDDVINQLTKRNLKWPKKYE